MMLQKFLSYITFWKKPEDGEKPSFNLRMMHGINRISILIFILAVLFMAVKYLIL
ncbi:MAG: DUF6728 family protein [Bacteroidota bacterium]